MVTIIVIISISWYLIGLAGFIYWWTKDYDFTFDHVFFMGLMAGTMGLFSWIAGWRIHGERNNKPCVIIRKRP